jgi:hypothetical protein
MAFKKFKIADVITAMEENGYIHAHGDWFIPNSEGVITRACIMGQAALNLGVVGSGHFSLERALNLVPRKSNKDEPAYLASKIIDTNDHRTKPKYSAVLKKVKEILEPYKDVEIEAEVHEYNARKKQRRVKKVTAE